MRVRVGLMVKVTEGVTGRVRVSKDSDELRMGVKVRVTKRVRTRVGMRVTVTARVKEA